MKKVFTFLCLLPVCLSFAKDTEKLIEASVDTDIIYLQTTGEYASYTLTIAGGDITFSTTFESFETPTIDLLIL